MSLPKERVDEIIRLYKDGYSIYAIRRITRTAPSTTRKYLKKFGLKE